MITQFLTRSPDEVAYVYNNKSFLVRDIFLLADKIEKKLASVIQSLDGQRLQFQILTQNPHYFLSALLASWRKNQIVLPVNAFKSEELGAIQFENDEVKIVLPSQPVKYRLPKHADIILSTTGSTGQSKGVVLSLNKLMINASLAGKVIGLQKQYLWGIDVGLHLTSGLCHLLMAWLSNATVYFLSGLTIEEKKNFFKKPYSCFGGSPVQILKYANMLESEHNCEVFVSSGDFLTREVIMKVRRTFPKAKIYKFYGLTEAAGRFCVATDLNQCPDTVGVPLPGYAYTLENCYYHEQLQREVGEVRITSPLLFYGYIRQNEFYPILEQEFSTGDLGYIDDNKLYLIGRQDDVFKVGGEKVDRVSIEKGLIDILAGHDYCILPHPHPHPQLGFCPALFVEKKESIPLPSWLSIISSLRKKLDPRFLPMYGYLVDTIPREQNGKIIRRKLVEQRDEFDFIK